MNLFRGALSAVQSRINSLNSKANPYEIIEFTSWQIQQLKPVISEDCLTLYNDKGIYVCVLSCSTPSPKLYSLFRLQSYDAAMVMFSNLSAKLLPLIASCPRVALPEQLQRVVNALSEHMGWSCAHLAAFLELGEAFRHPAVQTHLNDVDEETRVTPIMLSVSTGNVAVIRDLLLCKVNTNLADYQGNNVFHYAAKATDAQAIQLLASCDRSAINQLNAAGESALHVACENDKPDSVECLLRWGVDPELTRSYRYPIHCALKVDSLKCTEVLLRWSKKQLQLRDKKYQGTPLHWAKTKEAIYMLSDKGADVDALNNENDTALHIMIRRERLDCAIGLLVQGASADIVGSGGNNPLHLAIETGNYTVVQAIIVFGADVNYMNEHGCTPRHKAAHVQKDNRDNLLYVLHRVGAKRCPEGIPDCNEGCSANGTSNGVPKTKAISAPKALKKVIDDAVTQHTMQSAMSRSSSMSSMHSSTIATPSATPSTTPTSSTTPMKKMTSHVLAASGRSKSLSAASSELRPPGDRVLSLDGGGIRGLVMIQLLQKLETITGKQIKDLFDWIGGTSTGGILALAMSTGKTVRQCFGIYFRMKNKVFEGSRPYSSELFENFLKKEFGEHSRMTDIEKPRVIVTAVLGDRNPADLHLFKNYETPGIDYELLAEHSQYPMPPRPHDQYIWRAARSSGAAPTYFRAYGRFLDGGLMSNNPSIDVLTEIHEYHMGLKATARAEEIRPIHVLVSLGTGCLPIISVDACDVYRPDGIFDVYNIYKNVMGAKNLGLLLVEAATQSEGRPVERARAWCSMIGVPFFRFSPDLSEDVPLDCSDDATLINMLWEVECYIHDNEERFSSLGSLLSHA